MHVNYFFIIFTLKIKESQCFCLIFLMLTLKKFYFVYVICMHVISQPLYIVCPSEMWTFASWGTEVANSFFPCMARLRNSVPAYCFPLSYNLDLLKDNISMHLASLSITWKPTNKNIGNFISYPKSLLINLFEKWCPVFNISHITWSHSRCNCIHFGTLLYIILRLLSKHLCLLPFPPLVQFL